MVTKLPLSLIQGQSPLSFLAYNNNGLLVEMPMAALEQYKIVPGVQWTSNTSITISVGWVPNALRTQYFNLATTIVKTTSAFAAGTNNGGMADAVTPNSWYYTFVVRNTTTSVLDIIFTSNRTTPTVPSGWEIVNYIGAIHINGTNNITRFTRNDKEFRLDPAVETYALTAASGTVHTVPLLVPDQISLVAHFSSTLVRGAATWAQYNYIIPTGTTPIPASPLHYCTRIGNNAQASYASRLVLKNQNTLDFMCTSGGGGHTLRVFTAGWTDHNMVA